MCVVGARKSAVRVHAVKWRVSDSSRLGVCCCCCCCCCFCVGSLATSKRLWQALEQELVGGVASSRSPLVYSPPHGANVATLPAPFGWGPGIKLCRTSPTDRKPAAASRTCSPRGTAAATAERCVHLSGRVECASQKLVVTQPEQ